MSLLFNYIKTLTVPNEIILVDTVEYSKEQLLIDCQIIAEDFFYDKNKNIYAIYLPRSYAFVISILASLNTQHVFLPLDNEQSYERTQDILNDSNAKYIISLNNIDFSEAGYMKKLNITLKEYELVLWEKLSFHQNFIDSEAAYLIYSSGSTGKPKGILLKEKGILEVILEQINIIKITQNDKFAWCLNPSFDASLSDIFVSLLSGATLHIYPYKLNQIKKVIQFFNTYKITYSDLPPSLLKVLNPDNFFDLKGVIFGGEVCPIETLKKWNSQCLLINAYGPTETTICSSMSIHSNSWNEGEIGVPLKGVYYWIENDEGVSPILNDESSKEGMLLISGEHLAISYYNNQFLNEKHFFIYNNTRFYRTFDLVRQQKDKIIYLGRADRQLKVNGVLICPEEIENFLFNKGYEVVVGLDKEKKLNLWYTDKTSLERIKNLLTTRFKQSFIPNKFNCVETIPLNQNHKIDWKKLMDLS